MEPTFKWELQGLFCKPAFTDKYGNLRTEVIKKVGLSYVGELEDKKEQQLLSVSFSLINLSTFVDRNDLSDEQIINMALSAANPKEVEAVKNIVKNRFVKPIN